MANLETISLPHDPRAVCILFQRSVRPYVQDVLSLVYRHLCTGLGRAVAWRVRSNIRDCTNSCAGSRVYIHFGHVQDMRPGPRQFARLSRWVQRFCGHPSGEGDKTTRWDRSPLAHYRSYLCSLIHYLIVKHDLIDFAIFLLPWPYSGAFPVCLQIVS